MCIFYMQYNVACISLHFRLFFFVVSNRNALSFSFYRDNQRCFIQGTVARLCWSPCYSSSRRGASLLFSARSHGTGTWCAYLNFYSYNISVCFASISMLEYVYRFKFMLLQRCSLPEGLSHCYSGISDIEKATFHQGLKSTIISKFLSLPKLLMKQYFSLTLILKSYGEHLSCEIVIEAVCMSMAYLRSLYVLLF